jgi:methionine-rich copper-binding protein CopC
LPKYREKVFLAITRNYDRIFLIIVLFTILYLIGNYTSFVTVSGHAIPIASNPRPDQIIDSTASIPSNISITFDERPELDASTIRVTDSNGTRIDNNDLNLGDSEKELTVSLNTSKVVLGDYFVEWFAFSKDDGLITKGSYSFSYASDRK